MVLKMRKIKGKESPDVTILSNDPQYKKFLNTILEKIYDSQYKALRAVNRELVKLYWDIGKEIIEKQEKWGWGKAIVEQLAQDLQKSFPGIQGFSTRNLWRMRDFFLVYHDLTHLHSLVLDVSWTHNTIILSGCKDNLEREFYLQMVKKFGWTKNVLLNQIENRTYFKTLTNQTNFDRVLSAEIRHQAKLAVKDEYGFGFLELGQEHSEKELERALILNIEDFLQEMGDMFTFIRSQYRIEVNDKEYFIDLLLYHRRLRCLVALELKIGEFMPEYIGKMQFYLALLDDRVRIPEEQASIGIILCKLKDRTVVEYALRESNKPIGVATYQILSTLPKELEQELPSPDQIAKILNFSRETSNFKKTECQIESLPKYQQGILDYLKINKKITNSEYQKIRGVKKRQATEELKELVEKGILKKIGARGRGTYYVLFTE